MTMATAGALLEQSPVPMGQGGASDDILGQRRPSEHAKIDLAERMAARWELARRDPWLFLRWFVFTIDTHDQREPIKQFPATRPHIREMVNLWRDNRLLTVCKSRQMLMTWLFSALALWDAMMHPGRLIMLQSKREEDAIGNENTGDGLLGRAKFILDHVPWPEFVPRYDPTANKLEFAHNSTLWAIPQGAHIIRQRTASGILSDEAAFQDEFSDAYTAARPCIRGGGWMVVLSTPHPGFMQHLHQDAIGEWA